MTNQIQDNENWTSYFRYGQRVFFHKGSKIFQENHIGNGFYYLFKGLIKIYTSTAHGKMRILNFLGPGYIFGEQVLDRQPYFSTAVAMTDSVLYYFSREQIRELLIKHPDLINLLSQSLARKMNILLDGIRLSTLSSEEHLAAALFKISALCQQYDLPITQQELADYTGFNRITVYKVLRKWKEEGLIKIQNKRLLIKQPEILKQYTPHL